MSEQVSFRQNEVIALVMEGLSNTEIGERLFITEKTVKYHLTQIYKILEVKSRMELMAKTFIEYPYPEERDFFKNLLK